MVSRFQLYLIIFSCFTIAICHVQELSNSCTRMDFEEKMLERMITLQHTVKTTLSDIDAKCAEYSTNAANLLKDIETFKTELQEEFITFKAAAAATASEQRAEMTTYIELIKDNMNETMEKFNDATRETLAERVAEQDMFVKFMTSRYKAIQVKTGEKLRSIDQKVENITSLLPGRVHQEPVAFVVRFSSDAKAEPGSILKFDTIVLNVNNAYSSSDGLFTAPVSGLYMFSVQVCVEARNYVRYQIQSESTVYSVSNHGESDYDDTCTSVSTVAVLVAEEHVFVRCNGASMEDTILESRGSGYWSMFSGALIHGI